MNMMYHKSLPIDMNQSPNSQPDILMTHHSNGIASARTINAIKAKKSTFNIVVIASCIFCYIPP